MPTARRAAAIADARSRLIEIVRKRSYQSDREFTLASGKTSTRYFNLKPTMLDAEGAALIAELLANAIADLDVDLAGGLEIGAVPLAALLTAASFRLGHPVNTFFIRKAAKGHGTNSRIEGLAPGEKLLGKRVVVLEDVTTTGGSALQAIEVLRAEGAIIARIITVLDREEGAAEAFSRAGFDFRAILRAADFA